MNTLDFKPVKTGLALTLLLLVFGIGLGISFGVAEDSFQDYLTQGIAANPAVHDANSQDKIWRYAQRAHFHAAGIATFSIVLILLTAFSSLKMRMKTVVSTLISLVGLYPLAWFAMFLLSPSLGRDAAHHHIITELLTYIGTGGLLLGMAILFGNLLFGMFKNQYRDNTSILGSTN
jgi:hypothetical protein